MVKVDLQLSLSRRLGFRLGLSNLLGLCLHPILEGLILSLSAVGLRLRDKVGEGVR